MKYFEEYLSSDLQSWDDVDISVHCDIQIFDWLMKYAKRASKVTAPPGLDPSNAISILISSDFLSMDVLVDECLEYCHHYMEEILALPCNMNCVNDALVSRIAAKFTHHELDKLKDRKDKFRSKLFIKHIEMLMTGCSLQGDLSTLYQCLYCQKLLTQEQEAFLDCQLGRETISRDGQLVYIHLGDPKFDVHSFIVNLKRDLKYWRDVYWQLWGLANCLKCASCNHMFQCRNFDRCAYHVDEVKFTEGDKLVWPLGQRECCNEGLHYFSCQPRNTGCVMKDHVVVIKDTDPDYEIYTDLLTRRELVVDMKTQGHEHADDMPAFAHDCKLFEVENDLAFRNTLDASSRETPYHLSVNGFEEKLVTLHLGDGKMAKIPDFTEWRKQGWDATRMEELMETLNQLKHRREVVDDRPKSHKIPSSGVYSKLEAQVKSQHSAVFKITSQPKHKQKLLPARQPASG